VRHHAKFYQNRLNDCRDMAIKRFQNGGRPPSCICEIQFLTVTMVKRPYLTKFSKNWSSRCGDIAIFVFFNMAAAAILDLSGAHWDHPRRLLGGLYRYAKCGWNRCSTLGNM